MFVTRDGDIGRFTKLCSFEIDDESYVGWLYWITSLESQDRLEYAIWFSQNPHTCSYYCEMCQNEVSQTLYSN